MSKYVIFSDKKIMHETEQEAIEAAMEIVQRTHVKILVGGMAVFFSSTIGSFIALFTDKKPLPYFTSMLFGGAFVVVAAIIQSR